jgi:hypothetical protein
MKNKFTVESIDAILNKDLALMKKYIEIERMYLEHGGSIEMSDATVKNIFIFSYFELYQTIDKVCNE